MNSAEGSCLLELRRRVKQIEQPAATAHGVLSFGIEAIDRALPGCGLARGALHEILGAGGDEEDGALAAAFAAFILGRHSGAATLTHRARSLSSGRAPRGPVGAWSPLSRNAGEGASSRALVREEASEGMVLWCLSRPDLYGPGLAAHGLDPGRVMMVRTTRDAEILWAMEEGLRTPGIAAVVGEIGSLPAVASRRLQLAAERFGITAFLLRRWRNGGQAARERTQPNAATTRWRISALPSRLAPIPSPAPTLTLPRSRGRVRDGVGWGPGVGRPRWRVELLRCRGGKPAYWEMEVPDATDLISLAAALADRPAEAFATKEFRHTG
jgi:protein ImuA